MVESAFTPGMFPWDDIPDSDTIPEGDFEVVIEQLDSVFTSTGKLMFKVTLKIVEPNEPEVVGQFLFDNFVIGSDEDPEARSLGTWKGSFGAKRFKAMLKAANVPQQANLQELFQIAVGQRLIVTNVIKVEKTGEYKGQERNNIAAFAAVGKKQPKIRGKLGTGAGAPPMGAPPVPPQPPAQPAATPQPTPSAPAQPPAAPPNSPPLQPQAPPAPPAPPAEPLVPCAVCGQSIPFSQYPTHVAACTGAQG